MAIVSVDFFAGDSGNGTINSLRNSVATWYISLRNLAIVALVVILVYVGIRMALSTVAGEEAKYKKMLKDWVVGLALIFVLHYIMIFVIELNYSLVDIMKPAAKPDVFRQMSAITSKIWAVQFTVGWSALFVYIMMIGVTFTYLIMYIKRMITVGFLIIISPLITITYSIDKIADDKSQALNAWLKEFVFNVLIQPFHCIIYLVFVNTAMNAISEGNSLSASVLAVVMLMFMTSAEEIVKRIFKFDSPSLAKAAGTAALTVTGLGMLKSGAKGKAGNKIRTSKIPNMDSQSKSGGGSSNGLGAGRNQSNTAANNMNAATQGSNGNGAGSQVEGQVGGQAGAQTGEQTGGQAGGQAETPQGTASNSGYEQQPQSESRKKTIGDKIKSTARAVPGVLKSSAKRALKAAPTTLAKGMTYFAFAALGAAAGGKGMVAGLSAARAINKGISNKLTSRQANEMVKNNEKKFAGAYKNFQEKTGKTDAQMQAYTQNLMSGNFDANNMTNDEAEYYSYLKKMENTYGVVGEDDIENRMLNTIDMINEGTIEPEYNENNRSTSSSGSQPSNSNAESMYNGESVEQAPVQQSLPNSATENEDVKPLPNKEEAKAPWEKAKESGADMEEFWSNVGKRPDEMNQENRSEEKKQS